MRSRPLAPTHPLAFVGAGIGVIVACGLFGYPSDSRAQPINVTLSRLRLDASSPEAAAAPAGACQGGAYCADIPRYRALMYELGGAVSPLTLQPAHTLGPRHFYVGVAGTVANVDADARHWQLGTEGGASSTLADGNASPDSVVATYMIMFRQGLPLGFQFGAEVGHVARSNLWAWGIDVQWAILEGYRDGPLGFLPDVALRVAVHALTGDRDFSLSIPSAELILSKPLRMGANASLTPILGAQLSWILARSEAVDLSPDTPAVGDSGCTPTAPGPGTFPGGGCTGDPNELADNLLFPRATARRLRGSAGLQLRYRAWMVTAAVQFDLTDADALGNDVPAEVARQWSAQLGTGLSY